VARAIVVIAATVEAADAAGNLADTGLGVALIHPKSLPGLTRQSIILRRRMDAKKDGCAGRARA
jgi:hypothetical protein